ncbi:MAG: 1-acyl-sn-glycerol-3-phosphate acyltransferase [Dictyoglomus sp. NZ13-RE01]|nr:MAG: 1-acyl-sn-glycerol-3-phosphate acyltransferase [Dictyoglomus sp. NZ13-RE01]
MRKKKYSFQIFVYKELATIFRILLRIFYKFEIKGIENIPKEGPAIIAPNHRSSLDVIVIASAIPRPIKALGKIERFKYPIFGRFARYLGGIPVDREHPDKSTIKTALEILKNGNLLLIFPEGTRIGSHKKIESAKRGVAYFASKTNAPIIPTAIVGADKIWPPERRIPKMRGKIKVVFGEPMYYSYGRSKIEEEEFTRRLMETINTLLVMEK